MSRILTLGVEEEFFAVGPTTKLVVPDALEVLELVEGDRSSFGDELRRCELETRTGICTDLAQVRTELSSLRGALIEAGERRNIALIGAGTVPLGDWRLLPVTPKERNLKISALYGRLAEEHVVGSCHVHVGVEGRDRAVEVIKRVRPWMGVLSALAASSPFWMGEDTGYESFRSMVWERWSIGGVTPEFDSYDHYCRHIDLLIQSGTIFDAGQVYWELRPGTRFETVEFRVADACSTVDESILQAGLARALVRTCLDGIESGRPAEQVHSGLLRAARWRAARFGLGESLVDCFSGQLVPSGEMVDRLVAHVRPALEEAGDLEEMSELLERVRTEGHSSTRQRRVFSQSGRLEDVVEHLIKETRG